MSVLLGKKIKIFALDANPELAKEIADELGVELGECEVKRFADGEIITRSSPSSYALISASLVLMMVGSMPSPTTRTIGSMMFSLIKCSASFF